ncbi:MAG: polynucleotide kinase-phosphatase [Candidatus Dormibacteria bacterium]
MSAVKIPELSLVVLIGASGSGKSTFASRHFRSTEILSSDFCRGLVSDDPNDQAVTTAAFDVLQFIAAKRLAAGRLAVIDATSVQAEARRPLVALAKGQHVLTVAVVLDVPERVCVDRNRGRTDRNFGNHVIRNQMDQLRRSMRGLRKEGFHRVYVLKGVEEIDAAVFERQRLWNDARDDHGPFDIVGDVHGCFDELRALLSELAYEVNDTATDASHAEGRRIIFLGDLVDRGPASPAVLRLVMGMVSAGHAICLPGNHEVRLLRALRGRDVAPTHGLGQSLEQLAAEQPGFSLEVLRFIDGLVAHLVLDEGRLVVAHAGLPEAMHGRASGAVRAFALYGDTTGETDEYGLPIRYPWAEEYRGRALVVYGHTPVPEPVWLNGTICLDTGCVFGGRLTALRYPEREIVSVPARTVYYEPVRPLEAEARAAGGDADRTTLELDVADVLGKRVIEVRVTGTHITIREENAAAALEIMSRFAIDPRWLVYLPPTMAPSQTSERQGLLEHPAEAFAAFRSAGVKEVVCEEKHMGSRAVVVVCRDPSSARRRFGIESEIGGCIYTRTGRRFFSEAQLEAQMLQRLRTAVSTRGLWEELETDWLALDCELLPWSLKAEELLRRQYASVGSAALAALAAELESLDQAADRGIDVGQAIDRTRARRDMAESFRDAYRRYCWTVSSIEDVRLAPFQLLAGGRTVRALRDHRWHLELIGRLAGADPGLLRVTQSLVVDVEDQAQVDRATEWWEQLTSGGGEGMVVKPCSVVHRGQRGLVQPGIKCRGREYLRIIYGPEYTDEEHVTRLKSRGLGRKRSLAIREFGLGIEGLQRFVSGEPLHRVHECVFGVLALESEPVDPRL